MPPTVCEHHNPMCWQLAPAAWGPMRTCCAETRHTAYAGSLLPLAACMALAAHNPQCIMRLGTYFPDNASLHMHPAINPFPYPSCPPFS